VGIRILHPGFLTSIQDLGRYGYQKYGVIVSGAMDSFAHRVANIIIGNSENTPALEMTIKGATIEFCEDTLFSICGGELSPEIYGEPVPSWRPILARKGTRLHFGRCQKGCRAYLAIAGGFDIPLALGSYSTYLRAEIGGYMGRALKKGDILRYRKPSELSGKIIASLQEFGKSQWGVASSLLINYQDMNHVRFIHGKEFHLFTEESQMMLENEEFSVSSKSDRMGYSLEGPKLILSLPAEMISEAVTIGTVQVPPDGNPIVLLADRQTIGGYPKIAQIVQVDLPILAQAKPGDKIRFKKISLNEAQKLFLHREKAINHLKKQVELMHS
jgi:antagonist of KipI